MKALTLTQPWASAIALGMKTIETRSWRTKYRGELLIHAAMGMPADARRFASEEFAQGRGLEYFPLGAVVALARLVDVVSTEDAWPGASDLECSYGDFSAGRWAWMLEDVVPLSTPILARGALSLWTPDAKLEAVVLAAAYR